jgi:hypothetical protein
MPVSPSSPEILRVRLRCDVSAPRNARRALDGLDEIRPVHDDALLVASELATSAVMEPTVDPTSEIELLAELVPDGLRIAVTDSGRRDPTAGPTPADEDQPQRMGLRSVQAIARRWGAERLDGQRVWAVLAM